ncbi:MAG TPA: ABC transporter substrate-binding protein [Thermodesulfobacteriota bacterium]|nr:ABC transporter substrate-binding protein [Thermodesulfobacteriota bacterium]
MKKIGLLSLLWVLTFPMPLPWAGAHPATEVVENLHKALLTTMKEGGKIGYQGRYDRLAPVIRASFDMPFIAQTVLGRHWEAINNEQKSKFIQTFSSLSVATYAYNFDAYSGEQFKVIQEKGLKESQFLIQTQLLKSDGGKVQLDYILHRREGEWRIINIIAEGVSDLALKRADYSSFLKSKGFDSLVSRLNEKIAEYSK